MTNNISEIDRINLPVGKIFCDGCKKAFLSQTSITEKDICKYMVYGKITGYSFRSIRPIKKVSMTSGHIIEKETYTRKFFCKNCYKGV